MFRCGKTTCDTFIQYISYSGAYHIKCATDSATDSYILSQCLSKIDVIFMDGSVVKM